MNIQEILNRVFITHMRVKKLRQKAAFWFSRATKKTGRISSARISGTTERSSMEAAALRYTEAETELKAAEKQLEIDKAEAQALINLIEDPQQKQLLELRYIDFMSFEDISGAMGYNFGSRSVFKVHRKAIEAIEKSI